MTAEKKKPLGRGLNALFGDDDAAPFGSDMTAKIVSRGITKLAVTDLEPSPFQPRKVFSDESLNELASSLRQHGMAQPMVVRPKPDSPGRYQIIAGERRWRAAQKVPMHEVPVVIQEIDDKTAMEIALIENLQRVDLNPLEEAKAFQRLIDDYDYKHDQLATVLGKSRSHISNMLRLLQLPEKVQDAVLNGKLTMGHARALITAKQPEQVAELVIKNNLSVRDTEKLAAKQSGRVSTGTPQKIATAVANANTNISGAPKQKDADIRALENNLSSVLGLNVSIDVETNSKGKLVIEYQNLDQLDDVLRRLSR
jgi:ParB family transcriptional regulator, chromosome partitioning protein